MATFVELDVVRHRRDVPRRVAAQRVGVEEADPDRVVAAHRDVADGDVTVQVAGLVDVPAPTHAGARLLDLRVGDAEVPDVVGVLHEEVLEIRAPGGVGPFGTRRVGEVAEAGAAARLMHPVQLGAELSSQRLSVLG
jgi:hypothetical protein